jgi:hypothetical protein
VALGAVERLRAARAAQFSWIAAFAWVAACIVGGQVARSGVVVLSGDSTPAFELFNSPNGTAVPGNIRFFSNVLGLGTNALVLNSSNNGSAANINQFYSSLPGKTCTLMTGTIGPQQLAGVQLLVLAVPDRSFTSSEAAAIKSFYAGGGSIFLLGEATAESIPFGPATDASINALLAQMSVPLSLGITLIDPGLNDATGSQIISDPLTAGVTLFRYGATTNVNGGKSLFLASGNTPMVTYVPEPALLYGLLLVTTLTAATGRTRAAENAAKSTLKTQCTH